MKTVLTFLQQTCYFKKRIRYITGNYHKLSFYNSLLYSSTDTFRLLPIKVQTPEEKM